MSFIIVDVHLVMNRKALEVSYHSQIVAQGSDLFVLKSSWDKSLAQRDGRFILFNLRQLEQSDLLKTKVNIPL